MLDKISITFQPVMYISTPAAKVETVDIKSKNECKNTAYTLMLALRPL